MFLTGRGKHLKNTGKMKGSEGKSVPVIKEFQMEALLAPVTPLKPMVPGQRPIYQNRQQPLSNQEHLIEKEAYLSTFTQQNQAETATVSSAHSEAVFAGEADQARGWTPLYMPPTQLPGSSSSNNSACGNLLFTSKNSIMDGKGGAPQAKETDPWAQWSGMTFTDLLAMNNRVAAGGNQPAMTSSVFLSKLDSNQKADIQESGFPKYYCNSYDLNSHPDVEGALPSGNISANAKFAFPDGVIAVFAPATPDHRRSLENSTSSGRASSSVDKHLNKQITDNNQVSDPSIHDPLGLKEIQSTTDSIAIESYNLDKGGNQDLELNNTIQQKTRRKKHRPKVIKEAKPKETRKQRISKPSNANETPRQKRKYVRRNKTNIPSATPPKETEAPDSKIPDPAVKSCRRALNFDLEDQVKENVSMHERVAHNALHPGDLFARSPNSSTCASSNEGEQTRGLKRANFPSADASNLGREILTTHCTPQANHMFLKNSTFSGTQGIYFPEICKKRRTEMLLKPNTSHILSYPLDMTLENIRATTSFGNHPREAAKTSKYYYSTVPHFNINAEPDNPASAVRSHQDNTLFTNWGDIDKLKKRRSKAPIRVRNLDSLKGFAECGETSGQQAKQRVKRTRKKNMETINNTSSAEALPRVGSARRTGKRNSRKRTTNAKSITSSFDMVNKHNQDLLTGNSNGTLLALPWIDTICVDAIIEGMKQLNINRKRRSVRYQEHNALIPYHVQDQQQNALVLYQRDGTMIPFGATPASKRRLRAKVDLDDETNRVWMLLLEDINNQGIDGTDEEKAKWWENERKVFRGRVDSFIARMRLVQGDRRFSPWKGSVVDSVVGVFLTQNVSDHLSSSAFMSLAARFPLKAADNVATHYEENIGPLVEEPEICIVDLDDNSDSLPWNKKTVEGPDMNSRTLHDVDVSEQKLVKSKGSHGYTNPNDSWCLIHISQEKPHEPQLCRASGTNKESDVPSASTDTRAIDDVTSSQHSVISSQNSAESPSAQTSGKMGLSSDNSSEGEDLTTSSLNCSASFVELIKMAETPTLHAAYAQNDQRQIYQCDLNNQEGTEDKPSEKAFTMQMLDSFSNVQNKCSTIYQLHPKEEYHSQGVDEESRSVNSTRLSENFTTKQCKATAESTGEFLLHEKASRSNQRPSLSAENVSSCYVLEGEEMVFQSLRQQVGEQQDITNSQTEVSEISPPRSQKLPPSLSRETVVIESTCASNSTPCTELTPTPPLSDYNHTQGETHNAFNKDAAKKKTKRTVKKASYDWDSLRKQAQANGRTRQRTDKTMDSLDWEAVRFANVNEVADTIKERGMNNVLAERIKEFLDRLVTEHGSIDLEWLRDVPPDKAKEYLLSIRGLGLKSVECVRLLTLHHLAFPVDTNVGRIAVRLGWVPLQPLPESLQLHLLELYPILESIQKYLWPRLCKLDQRTLYELHYHMITFGKVFCTKRQPNCNACPLRGECRHFASAFASARLALPGPEDRSIVPSERSNVTHEDPQFTISPLPMPLPMSDQISETKADAINCEPIVEIPASPEPEPEQIQSAECDIEDVLSEDPNEIPTIKLNLEEFTQTLQTYMQSNMELQEGEMSKALVALAAEAASIPTPKLKNVSRLRTEHHVYELPDTHQLVRGLDRREPDDPCSYLLAIWSPGETANSIEPPEKRCNSQEPGELCGDETCSYCNSQRETNSQIVRGTILIPCRTAMRGSFPLNGTYFQVNEVFADHDSSLNPIEVPRELIWNLPRRTVYFGTSIPTIMKGLSTESIQHCFWKGYVCVRGFDQKTRAPRPLMARLHYPASKMARPRGKNTEREG